MKQGRKHLWVAGLLAGMSAAVFAQATPPAPPAGGPPPHERMHRGPQHGGKHAAHKPDPAKFAEFMAKRQAALKDKLKITAAQEGAWTSYTSALKPPAQRPARADRAELEKLTTPQRIDRMQAMKAQRDAEMTKRADATKSFYAALSPEQQKVFDAEAFRRPHAGRDGRHDHRPGGDRGPGKDAPRPPAKG
jgi:protein CpxP